MFFGLTNSPASFQTMMNAILKDLIDQGHVVVYMDNILVFTKDLEEHRQIINEVLKWLKENDLFLKPQKCFFEQRKSNFLASSSPKKAFEWIRRKLKVFKIGLAPKRSKKSRPSLVSPTFIAALSRTLPKSQLL